MANHTDRTDQTVCLGRLVQFAKQRAAAGMPALRLATNKRMGLMLGWKPMNRPDINELLRLVKAGKLTPHIDRRYPLDEVVQALRFIDDGKARGKVLVVP